MCSEPFKPITISIHAPVKGATASALSVDVLHDDFNPRTREGCDEVHGNTAKKITYFNPRTREGCDKGRALFLLQFSKFQSTHP